MKPTFNLVSKTLGTSFFKYRGDAVRLSKQTPATVDEVVVALKDNPSMQRKITTFRDSNGLVTERAFDYFDKPFRNRLYSRTDNVIGEDEFVTSTTTKDYLLDRDALDYYKDLRQFPNTKKTILWSRVSTETNHISENLKTGEKVQSQVIIDKAKQKSKNKHTFIEFPHIIDNKVENKPLKFLSFTVKKSDNSIVKSSVTKQGVNFPENDSYLGVRALPIEDAKEPLTKRYIRERGLEDMNITIDKEYNPINEVNTRFKAIFTADEGIVKFNGDYTFKSKTELAKTSAHETEHGWHFFLQGRLNGGDTPWQTDMAQKFGRIKDPEQLEEAKVYDKAIKNYVPFWKDRKAYNENEIEIAANKKGDATELEYNSQGETIRADFPHIPQDML